MRFRRPGCGTPRRLIPDSYRLERGAGSANSDVVLGQARDVWVYLGTVAAGAGLYFLTVPASRAAHLNRGRRAPPSLRLSPNAVHINFSGASMRREHSQRLMSVLQVWHAR